MAGKKGMRSPRRGTGKAYAWLREHVNHVGQNCLKWPFTFNKFTGYATFGLNGKITYAHRWMCEQKNGPPPSPKSEAANTCGLMRARLDRLHDVWRAVEWTHSGDTAPSAITEAIADYRKAAGFA